MSEKIVVPINYLKSTEDRKNYWFHCFTDDKNFHRIYNVFKDYLELLKQTKGLISADFSLFRDYDEQVLIDNCRANRMIDYAVQQAGIPMIPTAGFAGESSWEWCFDGLPEKSSIAISSNGCLSTPYGRKMLSAGVEELQRQKQPFKIIVCGRSSAELEKYENIIYYENFSQRMQERIKNGK